jgi:FkbM family methyltransferase
MGKNRMMQDYDFIEIGTAFFDTLIEKATDDQYGLSIEPVKEYLDKLPDKQYVTKINGAVVADEDHAGLDLYYVDEQDIEKHNLGIWMAGCNSIGKPHDFHTHYTPAPALWHNDEIRSTLQTVNLFDYGLVKTRKIECFTYQNLIEKFNIGHVKLLKIDTEGYDAKILKSVIKYYNSDINIMPNEINFESNAHSDKKEIEEVKTILINIGYRLQYLENGCVTRAVR